MCKEQEKDSALHEPLNENESETLQLVEDEDGSELFWGCPECETDEYLIDV